MEVVDSFSFVLDSRFRIEVTKGEGEGSSYASLSFLRPSFELWIFHSNFGFFQGCSFERDRLVWLRLKEGCGWRKIMKVKEEWMGFYFIFFNWNGESLR